MVVVGSIGGFKLRCRRRASLFRAIPTAPRLRPEAGHWKSLAQHDSVLCQHLGTDLDPAYPHLRRVDGALVALRTYCVAQ